MDTNSVFKVHEGRFLPDFNLFMHHIVLRRGPIPAMVFIRNLTEGSRSSLPLTGVFELSYFSRKGAIQLHEIAGESTYGWDIYKKGTMEILAMRVRSFPRKFRIDGAEHDSYLEVELGEFYFGEYVPRKVPE